MKNKIFWIIFLCLLSLTVYTLYPRYNISKGKCIQMKNPDFKDVAFFIIKPINYKYMPIFIEHSYLLPSAPLDLDLLGTEDFIDNIPCPRGLNSHVDLQSFLSKEEWGAFVEAVGVYNEDLKK